MKKEKTSTLGEAISLWAESLKLTQQINEKRLIASWGAVVGDYMASKTREIYIKNHILFVFVDSSIIRNELMLAKQILISRLNNGNDIIDDIIFR
ncbi:MAG: DUF721 domain-containing protein [Salinivirgaceae bacterium]|nr:DUF721 domain-containing protein [Salinivirgaceae bacterium]